MKTVCGVTPRLVSEMDLPEVNSASGGVCAPDVSLLRTISHLCSCYTYALLACACLKMNARRSLIFFSSLLEMPLSRSRPRDPSAAAVSRPPLCVNADLAVVRASLQYPVGEFCNAAAFASCSVARDSYDQRGYSAWKQRTGATSAPKMESSSRVTMSERRALRIVGYKMHQTSDAGRFRAAAATNPTAACRIQLSGW